MSDVKFLSIKLVDKGGAGVIIKSKETGIHQAEGTKTYHTPIHPNFKKAMDAFKVHLAILSGTLLPDRAADQAELEEFRVNGYHLSGKDSQEGIIIVGGRDTEYGYVGINTPLTSIVMPEPITGNEYILVGALNDSIKEVELRAAKYLTGEEIGQPSMFEEEKVTKAQIAEPESRFPTIESVVGDIVETTNKKKKGGKRVPQSPKHRDGMVSE